jgi:cytochrome c553
MSRIAGVAILVAFLLAVALWAAYAAMASASGDSRPESSPHFLYGCTTCHG